MMKSDRSRKSKAWAGALALALFVLAALVFCLAAGHHWSLALLLGLAFYILNNLVYALFKL